MAVTIEEVIDDLVDNADFEESSSVEKARRFSTAAKRFLILSPHQQMDHGYSITMSVTQIENLMKRAQEFTSQRTATTGTSGISTTAGGVRFLSAAEGFLR